MSLQEQEQFLRDNDWGWFLDALANNRDFLGKEEAQSPDKEGILRAKRDYYAKAVSALAEWSQKIAVDQRSYYPWSWATLSLLAKRFRQLSRSYFRSVLAYLKSQRAKLEMIEEPNRSDAYIISWSVLAAFWVGSITYGITAYLLLVDPPFSAISTLTVGIAAGVITFLNMSRGRREPKSK